MRQKRGAKKVRLTLDVSAVLNEKLDVLAAETGVSKSDVLRKAIALMEVAHQAASKGKKVGIARDEASLETEFVGL